MCLHLPTCPHGPRNSNHTLSLPHNHKEASGVCLPSSRLLVIFPGCKTGGRVGSGKHPCFLLAYLFDFLLFAYFFVRTASSHCFRSGTPMIRLMWWRCWVALHIALGWHSWPRTSKAVCAEENICPKG